MCGCCHVTLPRRLSRVFRGLWSSRLAGMGQRGPCETRTRDENGAGWVVSVGFPEEVAFELGWEDRERFK